MDNKEWISHNGNWLRHGEAALPVDARPVMYGDGCFETLRAYQGKFLHFDRHIERMRSGLEFLEIALPEKLKGPGPAELIRELLERNELAGRDAVVRIQVWRQGGRGYHTSGNNSAGYAITARPLPPSKKSWQLATVPTRRIPGVSLPAHFKLSGGTNYIRASMEADKAGSDDALMLTTDGWVSETPIANIFWSDGQRICTPHEQCDLLPGITREILLSLLREKDTIPIRKDRFSLEELYEAEAVWLCNSLREIMPVFRVDNHDFDPDHILVGEVKADYRAYVEREAGQL